MFCPTCGYAIEEDDLFCRKCGRDVTSENPASASRVFRRDTGRRKLAGVCAGTARYFAKDVTLIRIIWVGFAIIPFVFPGVVAYAICWLLMPADELQIVGSESADETAAIPD